MSGKRPNINQTGGNNNNSKSISTSYGNFDSFMTDFKQLEKINIFDTYRQVEYKVNSSSENNKKWHFIMENS